MVITASISILRKAPQDNSFGDERDSEESEVSARKELVVKSLMLRNQSPPMTLMMQCRTA